MVRRTQAVIIAEAVQAALHALGVVAPEVPAATAAVVDRLDGTTVGTLRYERNTAASKSKAGKVTTVSTLRIRRVNAAGDSTGVVVTGMTRETLRGHIVATLRDLPEMLRLIDADK